MSPHEAVAARIIQSGVVAILRTTKADAVVPAAEALLSGGVKAIEVTLTTPQAVSLIRQLSLRWGAEALIGAGTVLTLADCRAVLEAGASFVVSPITRTELVAECHAAARPVMLGAYTPTEAQLAHEAGADFIKIFPADSLGPSYIKALRAPLPHLRIVPTGGVDLHTAADFLKAGCAALGVGSSLVSARLLAAEDWAELTRLARAFQDVVERTRAGQG